MFTNLLMPNLSTALTLKFFIWILPSPWTSVYAGQTIEWFFPIFHLRNYSVLPTHWFTNLSSLTPHLICYFLFSHLLKQSSFPNFLFSIFKYDGFYFLKLLQVRSISLLIVSFPWSFLLNWSLTVIFIVPSRKYDYSYQSD